MTEEQIRKIIREELDRAFPERNEIRPLPAGPNYPVHPLPMPKYDYQKPHVPTGPWWTSVADKTTNP